MHEASTTYPRRRTFVQAVASVAGGSLLAGAARAHDDDGADEGPDDGADERPDDDADEEADDDATFVLEQGGECTPIAPVSGDQPVEDFYDYTYPMDRFTGVPGSDGSTFSSHGTTDLQRDGTSILLLYDGPDGLSLVVVHGRLDGGGPGGVISFDVEGLPSEGEWIVRDDDYVLPGGERPASNFDRWDLDGEVDSIDWAYRGGRTDGGAFLGLGGAEAVRIEPAFNEAAALSEEVDFGPVASWEVLSGEDDPPERRSLELDEPVTVRRGDCPAGDRDRDRDDDRDRDRDDDRDRDRDGEIDARIVDVSVASGTFRPGEEVPAEVTVKNTGDRDHTFIVGYSAFDPRGEDHHNDGTTDEALAIDAGETRTITVEWTVEDDVPSGTYDAQVIVWKRRVGDGLDTPFDRRDVPSAFEVRGTS